MTAHFRKAVRDKATALLTGLDTTGSNVWSGRVAPLTTREMPGLVVVPGQEAGDQGAYVDGPTVERVMQLIVIAEVAGNDGLYDRLDTIAGEVEAALFAADRANLDGLAQWIDPPNTELTVSAHDPQARERIGTMRMAFPIHYRTALADPTSQA